MCDDSYPRFTAPEVIALLEGLPGRIKQRRHDLGWSFRRAGADIGGVSGRLFQQWENGDYQPTLGNTVRLLRWLNRTVDLLPAPEEVAREDQRVP
jgi:transcriptional regulator with XRE-family HTH domain